MITQKFSLLGYFIGVLIIISSMVRWYWVYYDLSNFFFGICIGFIVIAFSYIYSVLKNNDEEHEEMTKMIDCLLNWKMKIEEKIK